MKRLLSVDKNAAHNIVVFTIVFAILACNLSQVANQTPNPPTPFSPQNTEEIDERAPNGSSTNDPPSNQDRTPPSRTETQSPPRRTDPAPIEVLATATPVENIETLLSTCPTEVELDRFNADFHILFDSADPFPPYQCQNGTGSGGHVNPRLSLYQGLRVIHALQFDQPLPWTEHGLYEWLKGAIHGIVITDTEYSHCCAAGKKIVLKADLLYQKDYQVWVNPQSGSGLMGLIGLVVHEARHAEIGGHTCGADDATLEELGAWGVQYYLFLYMAENTPATFFTQDQRQMALNHAATALSRICNP